MAKNFIDRIRIDLKESRINGKVALFLIPVAFFTYLFHEFGHWILGELSGNEMTLHLNNSAPQSGNFINDSSALWSAIGGPVFTIHQAVIFCSSFKEHSRCIIIPWYFLQYSRVSFPSFLADLVDKMKQGFLQW